MTNGWEHGPDCGCHRCREMYPRPESWGSTIGKGILIGVLVFLALVIFGPLLYHMWWQEMHCTMVLGTQVCQ